MNSQTARDIALKDVEQLSDEELQQQRRAAFSRLNNPPRVVSDDRGHVPECIWSSKMGLRTS